MPDLRTVGVPDEYAELFVRAEQLVSDYFDRKRELSDKGSIEIDDERYVLVRATSLSIGFVELVESLYHGRRRRAHEVARNLLYHLGHSLGRADARALHERLGLVDPVEKLSAGPVHFAHTGWASVRILPESRPVPTDDFFLVYDHPYAFEAEAWQRAARQTELPVCQMNAGYSSGWCEESFGLHLAATEILCTARGDAHCRFVMGPPERLEALVDEYVEAHPESCDHAMRSPLPGALEPRELEDRLRASLGRYEHLFEAASDGMLVTRAGRIDGANRGAQAILCRTQSELAGLATAELVVSRCEEDPSQARSLEEAEGQALAGEAQRLRLTLDGCSRGNVEVEVAISGVDAAPGDLLYVLRDITAEARMERILLRQNELGVSLAGASSTQDAVKLVLDGFIDMSGMDSGVVHVFSRHDGSLEWSHGRGLGEELASSLESLPSDSPLVEVITQRRARLFDGPEMPSVDVDIGRGEGITGWLVVPVVHGGETLAAAVLSSHDGQVVPEDVREAIEATAAQVAVALARIHAEERSAQLMARGQRAQKLESLGVLAGGIAHDFNNMLTGIIGGTDLALADSAGSEGQRRNLSLVRETATQAAALCRQLLAYSGRGRFVVERVDLSQVVSDMESLVRVSVSKRTELRLELGQTLPPVEADLSQLRQIVLNLVLNASEALGGQTGTVTISTTAEELDGAILGAPYVERTLPSGRYVCLEVSDTGCGMSGEVRERLFDPFFTTKLAGRGLGLAATLGIVRSHEGAIEVSSELGQGSTVRVVLPSVLGSATARRPSGPPRVDNARFGGTALVVDDEPTVRAICGGMLEKLGFDVLMASDGVEGVGAFQRDQDRVTVVLLDLMMPRMDGNEAFRKIRRLRPDVRVVLMSGYSEEDVASQFEGAAPTAFLEKPLSLSSLRAKLSEVLGDPDDG